jgi:hypothetical protein
MGSMADNASNGKEGAGCVETILSAQERWEVVQRAPRDRKVVQDRLANEKVIVRYYTLELLAECLLFIKVKQDVESAKLRSSALKRLGF